MTDHDQYWDRHTTPSNLPEDQPLTAERWPEEAAFGQTPERDFARRALGRLEGLRVLEIGCGVGVNAIDLARRGARVVALDSSASRLRVLKSVAADLDVGASLGAVCARAEHLPFRQESFDAAYTKATLIHTDLPPALVECRRVLRPGGRAVFCEPTTTNPLVRVYRRWFGPREWKSITRYFSPAEEKAIADAFGNLEITSFYLTAFLAFYWQFGRRRLKRFRRWLGALHAFDRFLFALCPPLRRWAWFRVYVAEKRPGEGGADDRTHEARR